ncbi:uncharacterized protein LOC119926575 [Tachyglossus aculeatus]|uniref:uncharacterized protein LOC119926575 n=1 Tax=Tachyglossus aculeatus TaxID=9261 RepID=UPI0018F6EEB1|nr:uncharacterized protein LOC119926575 [Tachyglossus aculeatus]
MPLGQYLEGACRALRVWAAAFSRDKRTESEPENPSSEQRGEDWRTPIIQPWEDRKDRKRRRRRRRRLLHRWPGWGRRAEPKAKEEIGTVIVLPIPAPESASTDRGCCYCCPHPTERALATRPDALWGPLEGAGWGRAGSWHTSASASSLASAPLYPLLPCSSQSAARVVSSTSVLPLLSRAQSSNLSHPGSARGSWSHLPWD